MDPVRTQKTYIIITYVEASTRVQSLTKVRKVSGF